jgi:cell division protein FtsX
VNEAFAEHAGLGAAVVGRSLTAPWTDTPYVIAGVVDTVRAAGPAYAGVPMIYWPLQEDPPPALTLVARVRGEPAGYLAQCRDAVQAVDRNVPVYDVRTFDERLADVMARPRFYTTGALFLTALALLLAIVGTHATAAYSVAARTHEIGVRMAIGASYGRVRGMLMRESLLPLFVGIAIAAPVARAISRYLEHLIAGTGTLDARTGVAAAATLFMVGLAAVWCAIRRLRSIDPAGAVRAS